MTMFTLLFVNTAAFIASTFGLIDPRQMLIISIIAIITMMAMVIILMFTIRKAIKNGEAPNFPGVRVIIPRARIDDKFVLANSDLLKKSMIPTNPFHRCVFRISMEINKSIEQLGISAVRLRESGTIENKIKKALVAKETYTIDTIVSPDEVLNFKFDNDVDIKKLLIDELYIP